MVLGFCKYQSAPAPIKDAAPTLKPDWDVLLRDLEIATGILQKTFVR